MPLAEVLPLARNLDAADQRALIDELESALDDDSATDPEVLALVHERTAYALAHPEECERWSSVDDWLDATMSPAAT